jgi:hypothetical protein
VAAHAGGGRGDWDWGPASGGCPLGCSWPSIVVCIEKVGQYASELSARRYHGPHSLTCMCRLSPAQFLLLFRLPIFSSVFFPQVCNHPELFEGQAERWPLQFSPLTTAIDDALKPAPQEVKAGPGRPPKAPAASMYIQVTGFKSHIQVCLGRSGAWCNWLKCGARNDHPYEARNDHPYVHCRPPS